MREGAGNGPRERISIWFCTRIRYWLNLESRRRDADDRIWRRDLLLA
jgi:hypothetical protein